MRYFTPFFREALKTWSLDRFGRISLVLLTRHMWRPRWGNGVNLRASYQSHVAARLWISPPLNPPRWGGSKPLPLAGGGWEGVEIHNKNQGTKGGKQGLPVLMADATRSRACGPLAAKPACAGWVSCPRRWTSWLKALKGRLQSRPFTSCCSIIMKTGKPWGGEIVIAEPRLGSQNNSSNA